MLVLAVATAALTAGAGAIDGRAGINAVVLALVVTAGLLLDVQLPQGGSVPIGHAFVMALAFVLPGAEFAFVASLGMLALTPILGSRLGTEAAIRRVVWWMLAAAAAALVTA